MVGLPLLVFLPSHLLFRWLLPPARRGHADAFFRFESAPEKP
jgi:hypothetical protein